MKRLPAGTLKWKAGAVPGLSPLQSRRAIPADPVWTDVSDKPEAASKDDRTEQLAEVPDDAGIGGMV